MNLIEAEYKRLKEEEQRVSCIEQDAVRAYERLMIIYLLQNYGNHSKITISNA